MIVSAFTAITRNNLVYSLVFLIIVFLTASLLLLILECEFLALLFIAIYVGAISTLFLFSVMLLDFKASKQQKDVRKYVPLSLIVGFVLLAPLVHEINIFFPALPVNNLYVDGYINWYDLIDSTTDIEAIGLVLYSHFILHLLLVGLILLSVLFGVVHLMNDFNNTAKKRQVMFKQLSKKTSLGLALKNAPKF